MTTVLYLGLTFDLKVKCHGTKQKPIYDLLSVYNTTWISISRSFQDSCRFYFGLRTLTSRGQTPHPILTIFKKLLEGIICDMWPKDEVPASNTLDARVLIVTNTDKCDPLHDSCSSLWVFPLMTWLFLLLKIDMRHGTPLGGPYSENQTHPLRITKVV